MHAMLIVRDFKGEPLRRVLVGYRRGLVYVANPDLVEDVNNGDSYPVGFSSEDAYAFDNVEFSSIPKEWKEAGKISDASWKRLQAKRLPIELQVPAQEAAN